MNKITLRAPDDCHIHLRDGEMLELTVPQAAASFRRAIVMPNLLPPVDTLEAALAYYERIVKARPQQAEFEPLMTLYLTPTLQPQTIFAAQKCPNIIGVKLYPAGVTTHSDQGLQDLHHATPVFEALSETGMPLLIHGEVNDPTVDIFDREAVFIQEQLIPLLEQFPKLRVVLEHITTEQAVDFVTQAHSGVAATITPHHLLLNRNDLLAGGIKPHHYCLPILKRHRHQQALQKAVISGSPKFFLGTDSAPHLRQDKQSACGCAGIYNAPHAIEILASVFDKLGALNVLEDFCSSFGADFYQLPRNTDLIHLRQIPWKVPKSFPVANEEVIPLLAGQTLAWQREDSSLSQGH